MADGKKAEIKWDEQNLAENAEEAENAQRQKIDEPKTPFHRLDEDGETPHAFPPKARPARAAEPSSPEPANKQLQPGMDLSALAGLAEERRENIGEDDEVEQKRKFEEHRKNHYRNVGGLAALRAKAAQLDEEDEDDDDS